MSSLSKSRDDYMMTSDGRFLRRMERNNMLRWEELHGYRERYLLPEIPASCNIREKLVVSCHGKFDDLERCVQYGVEREHPKRPFERLPACKPHYVNYIRCVRKRNSRVLKEVKTWEENFVKFLDAGNFSEYLEILEKKRMYKNYLSKKIWTVEARSGAGSGGGFYSVTGSVIDGSISDLTQRIISIKSARGMELDVGEREFLVNSEKIKVFNLDTVRRSFSEKNIFSQAIK